MMREAVDGGPDQEGDLDLRGIGQAVARRRKWIAGSVAVAVVGTAIYVTAATPRYAAEAKVLIENQETAYTRPDKDAADVAVPPDEQAVTSQVQVATSRDLGRNAIRALNLFGNPEFDPLANGLGLTSRILSAVGLQHSPISQTPEDRILDTYYEHLNVQAVVKSRVLSIEFSSRDPQLAAKGANTVADLYIDAQSDAKRDRARVAAASLSTLIADLRVRLTDASQKAEAFRSQSGLFIGANNATLSTQQLADLNTQLTLARTAQADAQAKAKLIRDAIKQGRLADIPDIANNELIRRYAEQRVMLKGQLALEARTLLPQHPRMKELNAQLADLDSEIRQAGEKAARTLENDARLAGARYDNLQATLDQQKKTAGASNVDDVKLRDLDRTVRLLQDQLESATAKYQDATARQSAASTTGDARVISRAVEPPVPVFPKKGPLILFAGLAGLILSLGAVVASELLSGRAYLSRARRQDGEAAAPAVVMAPTPTRPTAVEPAVPVVEALQTDPQTFVSVPDDVIDEVAARIAEGADGAYAVRTMVTASGTEFDIAQASLGLGRSLARDKRVVLIDLVGAPVSDRAALQTLLSGEASFAEVIHRDKGSRLHLVSGTAADVRDEGFDLALEALSQTYDFVIVSVPPAGEADSEASRLAPHADFAVLLAHEGTDAVQGPAITGLQKAGAGEVLVIEIETASESVAAA